MRQADGTEALARVRAMRRIPTAAEALLWTRLRSRRLAGIKFRRQMWIGPYIADFASMEVRLVVEVDGRQHAEQVDYDRERDRAMARAGYRVLRFWNNDVINNIEGVLELVRSASLERLPSPSHAARGPLPLPKGEGR